MIKIKSIEWDINILKGYIYEKDGMPKLGKKVLSENFNFIVQRLNKYENNIKDVKCIDEFEYSDEYLRDNLYKIYDSSSMKSLKDNIRLLTHEAQCPYCSLQINPYEIDHYLPRSVYPEYSIFTLNLVPSCPECNSRLKKTNYKTSNNIRAFIHPYFDESIIEKCFLDCEINVINYLLEVEYFLNLEQFDEFEKELVQSHFQKLELKRRFKYMIIKEFEKFYRRFTEIEKESNKRVFKNDINKSIVIEKVEEEINLYYEYNCNYYIKVFWKKFKECEDCLKLIYEKRIKL